MSDQNLRPVWDALLSVYTDFLTVCRAHNLRFWGAYGTLLGAVRHKGFIPWDDDLDVMMPRQDYDTLIAHASDWLPAGLRLVSCDNADFTGAYVKIQDVRKETVLRVERQIGRTLAQGIFIDVFPMDGMAPTALGRMAEDVLIKLTYCRTRYLFLRESASSFSGRMARWIGCVLAPFYRAYRTSRDFAHLAIRWGRRHRFDGSAECGVFLAAPFGWDCRGRTACFESTVWQPFEDTVMPVPTGYDELLTRYYGDYMTPPPPERRVPTHMNEDVASWRME